MWTLQTKACVFDVLQLDIHIKEGTHDTADESRSHILIFVFLGESLPGFIIIGS